VNQKGNVGMIVALIIGALVGVVVLNSMVSSLFCGECTSQTPIAKNLTTVAWVNDTCVGDKCSAEPWSVTCNGTTLIPGNEYDIDDCDVLLTNATWNNTICYENYESSNAGYTGILAVIVCMLPVLVALGILVLAVSWAML